MSETKHYTADEVGQLMQGAAKEISRVTDINVALLAACKQALVALRECNEPEAKIVAEAISKAEGRAA